MTQEMKQLIEKLKGFGIYCKTPDDLLRFDKKLKYAVPVLLDFFKRSNNDDDKELIVRALTIPGFNDSVPIFINEFRTSKKDALKWAIGNALAVIKPKELLSEIMKLAKDIQHGIARQMIVIAIGYSKKREALPLLLELLDDHDVQGHAVAALGSLGFSEAIPYLIPFVEHEKTWIRKEALLAIKKLQNVEKVE